MENLTLFLSQYPIVLIGNMYLGTILVIQGACLDLLLYLYALNMAL